MKDPNLNDFMRSLQGLPDRERKRRLAEFLCKCLSSEDEAEPDATEETWFQEALAGAFYIADSPTISKQIFGQVPPVSEEDLLPEKPDLTFRAIPKERIKQLTSSIISKVAPKTQAAPSREMEWNSNHLDLARIRYRGDAKDLKELEEIYKIEELIQRNGPLIRAHQIQQHKNLLAEGTLLTAPPAKFEPLEQAATAVLGAPNEIKVFKLPGADVNASAILGLSEMGNQVACIGITQGALDLLDNGEKAFLIGHELGHFLFKNHRMNGLLCSDPETPAATILPPLGESLFMRWRKKAELSADRIGLLACGDLHVAVSALVRAEFGLLVRNIQWDIGGLLGQIDDLVANSPLSEGNFASHPFLPIRVRALQLFARSAKARDAGYPVAGEVLSDDELCSAVDALIGNLKRHPKGDLEVAAMKAVALGGVAVLRADKEINEYETKILIEILQRHFTDEPEQVLLPYYSNGMEKVVVPIEDFLKPELRLLREEASADLKYFILSRLIDIGMADGTLLKIEEEPIYGIANEMGISPEDAQWAAIQADQKAKYRQDQKLNRAAAELQKNLIIGLQFQTDQVTQKRDHLKSLRTRKVRPGN